MKTAEQQVTDGDFLPDLCTLQATFALILVGELLSVALVLAGSGLQNFNWQQLGMISFLTQWIVLASAAVLCLLRAFLRRCSSLIAGTVSYSVVLLITLLFSAMGQWLTSPTHYISGWFLLESLLLAAIFAGIVLRYFYVHQQLDNQRQAELGSRIQALQSRIRPHFLFNSLNSIASLIETDPESAERMTEDLSELFRASLADPALVSVCSELELCKRYTDIEKMRMGERLAVDWNVSDCPPDIKIPSLLLQPLIENAIYHGIQPSVKGGIVNVSLKVSDGQLHIEVSNPIPDMPQQRARPGNGVALDNIRYRLAAHFGPQASCVAGPNSGHFVTRISYPL